MLNKIKYVLLFLIFLTSSFDIFLSIDIFGYTFRICQLLLIVLMTISMINMIKTKKIKMPIAIIFLVIWTLFVFLGTFNIEIPKINFAYHLWLIFNILVLFSFNNYFEGKCDLSLILKLYLLSFIIISIFGIIQFLLPFFEIKPPLVQQWWIPNILIRVNGFSYEPSYYATYLLIGWVMFRILFKYNKLFIENKKTIIFGLIVTTIAIILSTSRMGIIMLLLFEISNFIYNFIKTLIDRKYKVFFTYLLITICSILVIIISIYLIDKYVFDLNFLLNGTGLNETSAYSILDRFQGAIDVLKVFQKSPFIGYGLGGIYTEVANLYDISDFSNIQDIGLTFCVFAEALAASGIIGFIFLLIYFWNLFYKPIKERLKLRNNKYKICLIALAIALVFELIILQFNQNILRQYLWIHIGIIVLFYDKLIKEKSNEK